MVDYTEAIKRPFTDLKKSILAAIFVFVPIVNFLSHGYFLECAKTSMKNEKELPSWINFWDKFVKGFLFFIIKVIYSIPPFVIFALMLIKVVGLMASGTYLQSIGTDPGSVILKVIKLFLAPDVIGIFIFAIIVAIIISYLVPMAAMLYIVDWRFKDAFNFREIFKRVLTKKYFLAWLLVAVYSFLLTSVGSFIPYIGSVVALTLVGITSYSIFGSVYREIRV